MRRAPQVHYMICDNTKTLQTVLCLLKDLDNYCMLNLYGG